MSKKGSNVVFAMGVLGVAAVHLFFSFLVSFAAGISPPGSPWSVASKILMFPLLSVPALDKLPSWLGWPMWGALSMSWGFAICWAVRRLSRGGR
jgi:hypothetical protein